MEKATDTVTGSIDPTLPKFWIVTDHSRHEVILVLRGTMSVNELAIDLACDSWDFSLPGLESQTLAESARAAKHENERSSRGGSVVPESYKVHSGIWRIALAMGGRGKPAQQATRSALEVNKDYSECFARLAQR